MVKLSIYFCFEALLGLAIVNVHKRVKKIAKEGIFFIKILINKTF